MRVIDNGCSVNGGRCQFIHGLCRSVRKADRCELPPVTSMAAVERTPSRQTPTPCLVKPVAARRDFLGPMWDSLIGASVFNLRPRTGSVEPRRAQGWAHGHSWRTRTVIESGHWKAGGPGLRVLCSSASDRG